MAKLDWYIRANLKLRHLQLLVALDDLRSAGRVAAYLNVTQPAVSKMLKAIEEGVGVALFERTARGIQPTEYGACLVRHAREILDCLGNAHAELQDIEQGKLTRVSLGILPSMAAELIPRLVSTLEAETESVAISVREGTMESLRPGLRAGELDLVVGFLPAKPLGSEYVQEHLYEDPTVTVVRVGHPLSGRANLSWDELSDYPMILPPKRSLVRADPLARQSDPRGWRRRSGWRGQPGAREGGSRIACSRVLARRQEGETQGPRGRRASTG